MAARSAIIRIPWKHKCKTTWGESVSDLEFDGPCTYINSDHWMLDLPDVLDRLNSYGAPPSGSTAADAKASHNGPWQHRMNCMPGDTIAVLLSDKPESDPSCTCRTAHVEKVHIAASTDLSSIDTSTQDSSITAVYTSSTISQAPIRFTVPLHAVALVRSNSSSILTSDSVTS
jgi:hypothetical protein